MQRGLLKLQSLSLAVAALDAATSEEVLVGADGRKLKKAALNIAVLFAGESKEPPTEFRIFAAGTIKTTKGLYLFDDEAAQAVLADATDYGNDYPVDYNHSMLCADWSPGDPAEQGKAAGWFSVEVRNGELWATGCSWTPLATQKLKDREYRYISPTFLYDEDGRIRSLFNVALTNTPATKHLTPLIASRDRNAPTQENTMNPLLKALLAALSLGETATETEALSAIAALKSGKGPSVQETTLSALTGKSTAAEQLAVVQGWKIGSERAVELGKELEALKSTAEKAELDRLIEKAKADKKVTPAMEPELRKLSAEPLKALLAVLPAVVPTPVKTPKDGENKDLTVAGLSAEELAVCKQMSIKPEDFAAHKAKAGPIPLAVAMSTEEDDE